MILSELFSAVLCNTVVHNHKHIHSTVSKEGSDAFTRGADHPRIPRSGGGRYGNKRALSRCKRSNERALLL